MAKYQLWGILNVSTSRVKFEFPRYETQRKRRGRRIYEG